MAPEIVARERLKQILGGSPSPEVPAFILRRDAELILGGQGGYRISKYGAEGITYGLERLAEGLPEGATKDWLKEYKQHVARTATSIGSIAGICLLRGKWSRIFALGACFENLTYLADKLDEYVRAASPSSSSDPNPENPENPDAEKPAA